VAGARHHHDQPTANASTRAHDSATASTTRSGDQEPSRGKNRTDNTTSANTRTTAGSSAASITGRLDPSLLGGCEPRSFAEDDASECAEAGGNSGPDRVEDGAPGISTSTTGEHLPADHEAIVGSRRINVRVRQIVPTGAGAGSLYFPAWSVATTQCWHGRNRDLPSRELGGSTDLPDSAGSYGFRKESNPQRPAESEMNNTLEAKPLTQPSVKGILLIVALGAATTVGVGAMTLPDRPASSPPAVGGQYSHNPGVSYTIMIPSTPPGR
jgi:hypothetical protein